MFRFSQTFGNFTPKTNTMVLSSGATLRMITPISSVALKITSSPFSSSSQKYTWTKKTLPIYKSEFSPFHLTHSSKFSIINKEQLFSTSSAKNISGKTSILNSFVKAPSQNYSLLNNKSCLMGEFSISAQNIQSIQNTISPTTTNGLSVLNKSFHPSSPSSSSILFQPPSTFPGRLSVKGQSSPIISPSRSMSNYNQNYNSQGADQFRRYATYLGAFGIGIFLLPYILTFMFYSFSFLFLGALVYYILNYRRLSANFKEIRRLYKNAQKVRASANRQTSYTGSTANPSVSEMLREMRMKSKTGRSSDDPMSLYQKTLPFVKEKLRGYTFTEPMAFEEVAVDGISQLQMNYLGLPRNPNDDTHQITITGQSFGANKFDVTSIRLYNAKTHEVSFVTLPADYEEAGDINGVNGERDDEYIPDAEFEEVKENEKQTEKPKKKNRRWASKSYNIKR